MLKRVCIALAVTVASAAVSLGLPTGAAAAGSPPPKCKISRITGQCVISVTGPGSGAPPGGGSGGGGGHATPVKQACVNNTWPPHGSVPCTGKGLYGTTWWSNSMQCYISAVKPPPPASDPDWAGHYGEGAIYFCEPPHLVPNAGMVTTTFWSLTPPAGPAAPPDPRQLALQALKAMDLHAITIGIVPKPVAGSVGIIGMPTWMWAANPTVTTVGPITRTAAAAGYTVTATATVKSIDWQMGDGSTVVCEGGGTPYKDSYGRQSSPNCGHTYTSTGHYTVNAVSHWEVAWAGIGQNGVIPLDLTQTANIVMGEAQVISQ